MAASACEAEVIQASHEGPDRVDSDGRRPSASEHDSFSGAPQIEQPDSGHW